MTKQSARRVLVVDDEPSIVDAVATALRYEGFEVEEATTARAGLAAAQERRPDLIILDVMLPDLDGLEVTRRLRADGVGVPILFLTARDALEDKVARAGRGRRRLRDEALRAGRDRRPRPGHPAAAAVTGGRDELGIADLEMDERAHVVRRGGHTVNLTATEFNLLRFFLQNPRQVLSKAQILDNVWHYDFDGDANVVETYVSYLRKKLDQYGPPLIHTIRLVGYTLRESESG